MSSKLKRFGFGCLVLLLFLGGSSLRAQGLDSLLLSKLDFGSDSPMKISYVISDSRIPGYLDINIKAIFRDTIVDYKFLEDSLRIKEVIGDSESSIDVQKVAEQAFDMVTIIVDISSSMWGRNAAGGTYVDSAKIICDSIVNLVQANYLMNLYTFDEQLYRVNPQGENSIQSVKRPAKARYTHLYECVDAALGRMAEAEGKKLLIIIGDGENDHNKKLPVTITRDDLLDKIRGLDDSYQFLPIAIGPKIYNQNLTQIVAASASIRDSISRGYPGPGLWEEVKSMREWEYTHTILMKSLTHPHIGADRKVMVELLNGPKTVKDSTSYRLGGLYDPWNEQSNWQWAYFLGGLLTFLLFILFSFIVPWRRWADFKKKYVKFFWEVKEEGVQRYDPLTKFPFRDDDQVVVRCDHMQSLETWQYEGRRGGKDTSGSRKRQGQCLYYPHKCDSGTGPSGIKDFFTQKGFYKWLMWVFFGVLGGYLGFCTWAIFRNADFDFLSRWKDVWALKPVVQNAVDIPEGAPLVDQIRITMEQFLDPFVSQILLGFFVAFLITAAIALAMELSAARGGIKGFNIVKLIGSLLLRGTIAGLLTAIVFVGFGLGQFFVMPSSPYLFGLLALLLMGMIIGRALTTSTGIRNSRGLLAGLAGGFLAFHIYYIPMLLFNSKSFEAPKMLAFMAMGGMIGYVLSRSAPALEAAELDIYTGRKRYGTAFVTDLLRKNEPVIIGRGPTATVRLKVRYTPQLNAPGNVTMPFASLELRNEVVYLIPYVFTEVNEQPIAPNEKVPLIDGDRITFEHKSPSHLRYREFRSGPHPRRRRRLGRKKNSQKETVDA